MREKVICLVSGGIDSPVACALIARSYEVIPLHFCLYPYTCEETFLTVIEVLRGLKEKTGYKKALVYPWARVLDAILKSPKHRSYACLLCRRSMLRAAQTFCEIEGALAVVTGESLGQKATQTLQNLRASAEGIKVPILRPLLGFDKLEIEQMSKKLGIWRATHAGCCFATPRYPKTRARPEVVEELFDALGILELIHQGLEKTLEVKTFKEDFRGYLLSIASS